jgi:protein gp37
LTEKVSGYLSIGKVAEAEVVRKDNPELWEDVKKGDKSVHEAYTETKKTFTEDSKFNRTNDNIEWAIWTWNPVTGCKHGCTYCYARDIANRFYKEGFEPTFHPHRLKAPKNTTISEKDKKIPGCHNVFVCSMADLFGDWVSKEWIDKTLQAVKDNPQWNFLFLTKNPKRLLDFTFPKNSWIGATIDVQSRVKPTEDVFKKLKATVKFVSCEPLREKVSFKDISIFNWLIIGGQSRCSNEEAKQPKWEWVESLFNQARQNNVKVYFKPNLTIRPKEYPECQR